MPGTETGYFPSLSGTIGGVASMAYFSGASLRPLLIAWSQVIVCPECVTMRPRTASIVLRAM